MHSLGHPQGRARRFVLIGSGLLGVCIYGWIKSTVDSTALQTVRLDEAYGLLSLGYLYLSLLPTPLYRAFPRLRYRLLAITIRRPIGVVACIFAVLHTYIAFSQQLGGLAGIIFYSNRYVLAVTTGIGALIILIALALTSFDRAVQSLGKRWKSLHNLVYPAGVLVMLHVALIGAHFMPGESSLVSHLASLLLITLLILETFRFKSALTRTIWVVSCSLLTFFMFRYVF